jgi:hypothetical protein
MLYIQKNNNSLSIPSFQVSLEWSQEERPKLPRRLGDDVVFEYWNNIISSIAELENRGISPVPYKEGS